MAAFLQSINPKQLCVIALGWITLQLSSEAQDQQSGQVAVTTIKGEARISGKSSLSFQPRLHDLLEISECTIQTERDSELVLSLSNGVGLAIAGATSLTVQSYTQAPFSTRQEGLQFEPSVSELKLQLQAGSIGIAFEHLSPLSLAEVQLPNGRLTVHSGKVLAQVGPSQSSQVTVLAGTATLTYGGSAERAFLSAGQHLILSAGKIQLQDASERPQEQAQLVDSADYSRKRVLFRGTDTEEKTSVIWVTPIEQLEKKPDRPYSFEF